MDRLSILYQYIEVSDLQKIFRLSYIDLCVYAAVPSSKSILESLSVKFNVTDLRSSLDRLLMLGLIEIRTVNLLLQKAHVRQIKDALYLAVGPFAHILWDDSVRVLNISLAPTQPYLETSDLSVSEAMRLVCEMSKGIRDLAAKNVFIQTTQLLLNALTAEFVHQEQNKLKLLSEAANEPPK